MKRISILLIFTFLFFSIAVHAQLEKVIVEKYYISNAVDATNTIGGKLDSGSITYRIYVDLKPGYILKKIYGNAKHALKFTSDSVFFNNTDRGQSFGKDLASNRLKENTVALDSWITLGQTNKSAATTYFGVLKTQDTNGSIVGGINNDGGSATILTGLLTNTNTAAGSPLTSSDGLEPMVNIPTNWIDYGIKNGITGVDSSIFGSVKKSNSFISYNVGLSNTGVMGVNKDSNQILIAQLTTKSTIKFELNLEIADSLGISIFYVANDSVLLPNEKVNRFLKYPPSQPICGCPDPNYLEYMANRDCNIMDSCKTLVVLGCMDSLACNYDSKANYNIPLLCCYPGRCANRDISLVCPNISNAVEFKLYPNPAQDNINLQITSGNNADLSYSIFDSYGTIIINKNLGQRSGVISELINITHLNTGLYLMRVSVGNTYESKLFTKN
jgi:hypothetical protein